MSINYKTLITTFLCVCSCADMLAYVEASGWHWCPPSDSLISWDRVSQRNLQLTVWLDFWPTHPLICLYLPCVVLWLQVQSVVPGFLYGWSGLRSSCLCSRHFTLWAVSSILRSWFLHLAMACPSCFNRSWVGREVERTWEELWEVQKNMIKIQCIKK